ncbi:FAD:protein FMN transferase [Paenibacillus monticola]
MNGELTMNKAVWAQTTNVGMGTEMTHRVFGKHTQEALRAVNGEAIRLESILSHFKPESEISRINRSAGINCEELSLDTYELLSCAAEFASFSHGSFDVTVGPLVNLWDYKNSSEIPEEASIRQILPLVNYVDLILDPSKKSAGLKQSGQSIDLGGIGKGFASDKFLELFRDYGITSAFTNIGGNVAALGTKPDGSPWRVGIRHPRQSNRLLGAVLVADKAVVTSGDYQRYFVDRKGKRHHHILNPNTGYPAESGLISVTLVADSATVADALSTIIFVAGMEKGLELLKGYPGTEVILVDSDLVVYATKGLKNCFHIDVGVRVNFIA